MNFTNDIYIVKYPFLYLFAYSNDNKIINKYLLKLDL